MKIKYYLLVPALAIYLSTCSACLSGRLAANDKPVPSDSEQMILMLTDSVNATKGTLYIFEKDSAEHDWQQISEGIPVVLGRSGLAWGDGLNEIPEGSELPYKKEGDGKSPAGVFTLSAVFGYNSSDEMKDLHMPYIPLTEMTECIDDVDSELYNQVVEKDNVEKVDWKSSEKMRAMGIYYELGVIVDNNSNPIENGKGSCIFLHNWKTGNETMAGCTAMAPDKMKEIVNWLDAEKSPVLVQLTKELYTVLCEKWQLPLLNYNL